MPDPQVRETTTNDQELCDEWVAAVNLLVRQAEMWSSVRRWRPERQLKTIRDDPTGRYEVPQLWIAPGGRVVFLDPTSRFLPGGKGIVDLYLWPDMDAVMIPWTEDGWHVHLPSDGFDVERLPWSEESFVRAVERLTDA